MSRWSNCPKIVKERTQVSLKKIEIHEGGKQINKYKKQMIYLLVSIVCQIKVSD